MKKALLSLLSLFLLLSLLFVTSCGSEDEPNGTPGGDRTEDSSGNGLPDGGSEPGYTVKFNSDGDTAIEGGVLCGEELWDAVSPRELSVPSSWRNGMELESVDRYGFIDGEFIERASDPPRRHRWPNGRA